MKASVKFEVARENKEKDPGFPVRISKIFTEFKLEFEAVHMKALWSDIDEAMVDHILVLSEHEIRDKRVTREMLPVKYAIVCIAFGIRIEKTMTVDQIRFDRIVKDDVRPPVNLESLQNDIQQISPMLQSFVSTFPSEQNWEDMRMQVWQIQSWVHHILDKHFQVPMPPEFTPAEVKQD